MNILAKIKKLLYPLLILGGILSLYSQTFTYSGYIYGSNVTVQSTFLDLNNDSILFNKTTFSEAVKKALVEAVG